MINKQHPLYNEDLDYVLNSMEVALFKDKSFLITGSTGLLGVFMIDVLMRANKKNLNISVYAVGRNRKKAEERLGDHFNDEHFHFIEQDVRQPLPSLLRVDYVIPLASNTHPLAYSQYPIETIDINIKGAEYALLKAVECGATILYPSSVEIYGNARGEDVFYEDYTGNLNLSTSRSCYTESKRVSEAMCQSFKEEKNVVVKIVRLSRVFGPTMLLSDSKASSQFIIKALNNENIVLKSKGEQFFSYTYVADAVCAMFHVLLHGINGFAYNISSCKCNIHLKDFAEECAKWSGKNVIFDLPTKTELMGFSVATKAILDNSKLKEIGWKEKYDIKTAIIRTLDILRK